MNGICTPFAPGPNGEERSEDELTFFEAASSTDLKIYPNPNNGFFNVRLAEPAGQGVVLRIIGLSGQILAEKQADEGTDVQALEARELPAGLYFMQVVSENKVLAVKKFVKE